MPDNWENYKNWKELLESISKPNIEFVEVDDNYIDDDDVQSLVEMLRDYSE